MKKIITLCLALLLLSMLSCSALANAAVNYKGDAEKFIFIPGSDLSDTDLFENFKGMLPGDTLTQVIEVNNHTPNPVRIYMRAEPVDPLHKEFLSQLRMKVECKDETIFEAAPSETAQLTENTLLGTFKKNGSTELTVTLSVPFDMDNRFMSMNGVVPWTFVVEEMPSVETPHTGDWFETGLWVSVAAALALAIVVLVIVQRRRSAEN